MIIINSNTFINSLVCQVFPFVICQHVRSRRRQILHRKVLTTNLDSLQWRLSNLLLFYSFASLTSIKLYPCCLSCEICIGCWHGHSAECCLLFHEFAEIYCWSCKSSVVTWIEDLGLKWKEEPEDARKQNEVASNVHGLTCRTVKTKRTDANKNEEK